MNKLKTFFFVLFCLISNSSFSANDRIALVIGNSKYQNLGTLHNTINDAKAIEKNLKEIGYKTKLVIDVNEGQARKEIKNFALDSEKASIAVLFYAGHGAQVFGDNYLLPTDIEIPQRESDIQLSGIKIDDIINSIRSKTKVIFLDACRDNPALIKSLSKGRGSYQSGLAPTKNSSITELSSGIFIAYSTSSGNIALDGNGQSNSPFTSALAKFIKEPISIDDMFSKVTKEVKDKTNGSQKPYKYASLDGVVCLTSNCNSSGNTSFQVSEPEGYSNFIQGNKDSKIALITGEMNRQSNSKNKSSAQILNYINELPNKWVLFNFSEDKDATSLWFINPSSTKRVKELASIKVKTLNISQKNSFSSSKNTYTEAVWAFNCLNFKAAMSELKSYDEQGKIIDDTKFGDPEFIEFTSYFSDTASVGFALTDLTCNPSKTISYSSKENFVSEDWHRLYSVPENKSNIYLYTPSITKIGDEVYAFVKEVNDSEKKINDYLAFANLKNKSATIPNFKSRIDLMKVSCKENKYWYVGEQLYDINNEIIAYVGYLESENKKPFISDDARGDSATQLRKKYCE